MTVAKLDNRQIAKRVLSLDGWCVNEHQRGLERSLLFADFTTAFEFMVAVASEAEKMNHHPNWSNVYNRVDILLRTHTHDAITELDFELALFIDHIYRHKYKP